jgi:hypothetical protein
MNDKSMRSLPTVQSLDTAVRRMAARLANMEVEISGENPDGQLAKLWESVEELNLRVLFIMNTLQMTQTLSNIADASGKIPTRKMSALEAYQLHGGREKLIEGIEAQEKARAALIAEQEAQEEAQGEGLQTAEQTEQAATNDGIDGSPAADATAENSGPSAFVNNTSKFSTQ